MERQEGICFTEFENIIRKIMTENVGAERNEVGLLTALEKLDKLKACVPNLKAKDFHDLMRVSEATSLLQVAEISTRTALYRKESRNKPYHHRLDYPETNDEKWCGQVIIRNREETECEIVFKPLAFAIPAAEGEK